MTLLSTAQPHFTIRGEVSDDIDTRKTPDLSRVSLAGAWEADYWTHELGVSPGELMRIIGKVGNSVPAVRKELGLVAHENRAISPKRLAPYENAATLHTKGPLRDRLASFAKDTRDRAASLPPGIERDKLLMKARQADTVSHDDWVNSPPK